MTPSDKNPEDRAMAALLVPDILTMLEDSPRDVPAETEELHPADLADVVAHFPRERMRDLLLSLPRDRAADVLEYLDDELRTEIIEEMSAVEAASLVTQMTPDDRADALEELDEETAEEILSEIPAEQRAETERLLAYEADTAGGLMTTEFVSVAADTSVEQALEMVRALARSGRREAMYAIYATDQQGRLAGVLSLRELLAAVPGARIAEVAWEEVASISPSADREEAAKKIQRYDLVALPVVSESGHIMGVITVDDVIDVIQQEQTEDVQKFGGLEALDMPYAQIGFWAMIRKRVGWLAILFVGEMFTALATNHYANEMQAAVILAILMPLIISSGGNSGSQATSLIIRSLALGELTLSDWLRVLRREIPAGITLGAILGAIGFLRVLGQHYLRIGQEFTHPVLLGFTIWVAVIGVVTTGSMIGSMLPFVLRRFRLDPASASAPFVATLVDVTGLVIYFLTAKILLTGTLLP
jgi:magnesium transporter